MTVQIDNEVSWEPFGTHVIRFISPDIFMVRINGDVTRTDVVALLERMEGTPRPENGFFYLSNLTNIRHQSMQGMKEYGKRLRLLVRYTSIVGATFRHRFVAESIMRGLSAIGFERKAMRIRYFNAEADALAFFDELRTQDKNARSS